MSTHMLIDGYNLLAVLKGAGAVTKPGSEAVREQLIAELGAYRTRKGHAVTVVFDGWQQGGTTEHHEHRHGVTVIYSRRGERADQVLQRLAAEYRTDCAVVSTDAEVAQAGRASGAFVMTSQEFARRLQTPVSVPSRSVRWAAKTGDEDLPRRSTEKKGNPRKLPKQVRKRNRQIGGF